MKRPCIQLLAAMALLLLAANAQAAISCSISSPGFTTAYDSNDIAKKIVQTYFRVSCARGDSMDPTSVTYSVGVNNGLYDSGGNRAKRSNGNFYISYDLFTSAACSTLWGPSLSSSTLPIPSPGTMILSGFNTTTVDTSYWGCIPSGQNTPSANPYNDTVTMTLNYSYGLVNASGSSTLTVLILNQASCSISTPPGTITFNYTSFGPTINPTTTFGANCTSMLPYTMALDATSGTLLGLNYSLALSATSSTGTGVPQTHTITGTMVSGQAGTCAGSLCSATQGHTLILSY
jgi:spore coat protein U-like protein